MRYLGLVFLGLVLSAGQASAEELIDGDAVKILKDGKIIHMQNREAQWGTQFSVIYKDQYFVCRDDYRRTYYNILLKCIGTDDK